VQGVRSVTADVELKFAIPESKMLEEDAVNPPASTTTASSTCSGRWRDRRRRRLERRLPRRGRDRRGARSRRGLRSTPTSRPNLLLADPTSFVRARSVCLSHFGFNHGTHVAGTIAAPDNGIGTIGVAPQAKFFAVKVLSEVSGGGSFAGIIQGIVYAGRPWRRRHQHEPGREGRMNIGGKDVAELVNATAARHALRRQPERADRRLRPATTPSTSTTLGLTCDETPASARPSTCARSRPRCRACSPSRRPRRSAGRWNPPHPARQPGQLQQLRPVGDRLRGAGRRFHPAGQRGLRHADQHHADRAVLLGLDMVMAPGATATARSAGSSYSWSAGTSMAAPHVSGVAALIIGKNGGEMAPAAVIAALRASADDLGKPGNDDHYGAGRVNARARVQ
jgi:hypothetical protein